MGSSCFSRGNALVLEQLESLLEDEKDIQVELIGHLCLGDCSTGPNVTIEGKLYQKLSAAQILKIVKKNSLTAQKVI